MDLSNDLEIVNGLEILYIRSIRALVISDLHLGYEAGMAKEGVMIPKINLKNILSALASAMSGRSIQRLVVVGDIKNGFSKLSNDELNELGEISSLMKSRGIEFDLVKGNHDNFIGTVSIALGMKVYHEMLALGEYTFVHGDIALGSKVKDGIVVMGHEHPTIGIRTKAGGLERFRCFLYGKMKSDKLGLIVLPAIGYFETGSDINTVRRKSFSPILQMADIDGMRAIVVGQGSALDFGKIGDLRNMEV